MFTEIIMSIDITPQFFFFYLMNFMRQFTYIIVKLIFVTHSFESSEIETYNIICINLLTQSR